MPIVRAENILSRFRETVERLTHGAGRIGLAVSGGGDSLALLLIAREAMPDRIDVATVNHGLRAEAAHEAKMVADICDTLGVSQTILTPSTPISGTLQASARQARYECLEAWADERQLSWIATAHHVEDQAETLMMRLLRGSGIAGLSSIRERNGRIIRPLLGWRRAELHAIVGKAGLSPANDCSNHDHHFDRVRMRQAFSDNQWLDPVSLSKSAAIFAQANEALDWATQREAERRLAIDNCGVSLDPQGVPIEILRRLVMAALRHIVADISPRGAQISALIDALLDGRKTELAAVICTGGAIWHFAPAAPRQTK